MSHLGARFASESASFDPMTGFFNKQGGCSICAEQRAHEEGCVERHTWWMTTRISIPPHPLPEHYVE